MGWKSLARMWAGEDTLRETEAPRSAAIDGIGP